MLEVLKVTWSDSKTDFLSMLPTGGFFFFKHLFISLKESITFLVKQLKQ